MYRTNFLLMKEHNFNLSEIEDMYPFEREVYINLLLEYLEKKKQKG